MKPHRHKWTEYIQTDVCCIVLEKHSVLHWGHHGKERGLKKSHLPCLSDLTHPTRGQKRGSVSSISLSVKCRQQVQFPDNLACLPNFQPLSFN